MVPYGTNYKIGLIQMQVFGSGSSRIRMILPDPYASSDLNVVPVRELELELAPAKRKIRFVSIVDGSTALHRWVSRYRCDVQYY